MPSTFSPSLRIELIASGEKSGTWGVFTNNNLGDLIEQAITGNTALDVTAGNITLTALNGVSDQSRSAVLTVTGTAGVTRVLTIPNLRKPYTVKNNANATVQVKTASGAAFNCPTNSESYIYCDGLDVVSGRSITAGANAITSLASPFNSPAFTGVPTAPTAGTGTNTTQVATTAFVNAEIASDTANLAPLNSPALTGVPTAPTATTGTNTTQLATTAYVVARVAQDAPTKTGTGASGTWDIAITGNAATATNATNATNASNAVTQAPGTNNTTIATTAFVQQEVTALTVIPAGLITMWSGSVASIPAGWVLCDGTSSTPDLRDRFVVGAGSTYIPGNTGGAATATLSVTNLPSHQHGISGSGTTSAVSNDHVHSFNVNSGTQSADHAHTVNINTNTAGAHDHTVRLPTNTGFGASVQTTESGIARDPADYFNYTTSSHAGHVHNVSGTTAGNNASHIHNVAGSTGGISANHTHTFSFTGTSGATGSGTAFGILPPYYALAYIMKT
jgi:hypothetical protein